MQRKDLALRVLSTAAIMSIVTSIAAPAFAGTYYMENGDLSIWQDAEGKVWVKSGNSEKKQDTDNEVIICGGAGQNQWSNAPSGGAAAATGTEGSAAGEGASAAGNAEGGSTATASAGTEGAATGEGTPPAAGNSEGGSAPAATTGTEGSVAGEGASAAGNNAKEDSAQTQEGNNPTEDTPDPSTEPAPTAADPEDKTSPTILKYPAYHSRPPHNNPRLTNPPHQPLCKRAGRYPLSTGTAHIDTVLQLDQCGQ